MAKQRNPKGMGSFRTLPNGSKQWRQRKDGEERTFTAETTSELQEKIKLIADLPIIKGKYKVDDWFKKWLEIYVKPLKKQATYDQYRFIYNCHIKPEIGNKQIKNIKTVDIQSVIAAMNTKVVMEAVYDNNRKLIKEAKIGLSSCTMKHARKIMNIAFTKAYKDKIIPVNPVEDIEIPKKQAKQRKTLTPNELVKIFKSLETSRWIWSAKFMLVTGIRRGELIALKWSDVDIENKRLRIDESVSDSGIGDTKSSKVHYVPLSKKSIEYLNGQKEMLTNEVNPILHNEELKKMDLVFPNESGKMLKPRSYYTMLTRAAKKVGVYATPHCFRHTFVYMNRNTLSLKELQAILGHDESTTTLDIYGDIINMSTDTVAASIDSVFDKLDVEMEKESKQEQKQMGKVVQFRR
jgi:integrase